MSPTTTKMTIWITVTYRQPQLRTQCPLSRRNCSSKPKLNHLDHQRHRHLHSLTINNTRYHNFLMANGLAPSAPTGVWRPVLSSNNQVR